MALSFGGRKGSGKLTLKSHDTGQKSMEFQGIFRSLKVAGSNRTRVKGAASQCERQNTEILAAPVGRPWGQGELPAETFQGNGDGMIVAGSVEQEVVALGAEGSGD